VNFELLHKKSLEAYLKSAAYQIDIALPISPWRGLSHLANPRAEADDILLILAREKGELIGYLGILPDWIFSEKGDRKKMGWLSCLWVNPHHNGKGISVLLFQKAIGMWDSRVVAANYVPFTKKIYDRTGAFTETPLTRQGMRYYYRSDLKTILIPRGPVWKKYAMALGLADQILNFLNDSRLRFLPKAQIAINHEVVDLVDEETGRFIDGFQPKELFRRGRREWNWMLARPWVRTQNERDDIDARYYFSSTANQFRYTAVKMRGEKGALSGFMILLLRDGMMSVPACYVTEQSSGDAAQLINHFARTWQANTLTIFRKELIAAFAKTRFPWLAKKSIQRTYMVASALASEFDLRGFDMQDGDGDVGFT